MTGPCPMSVRELLNDYAGWYATDVGNRVQKLSAYESAIRSEVIKETATDILWREWTNRFPIDPCFSNLPKAEEGKFYLNTDYIKIISTKDTKTS